MKTLQLNEITIQYGRKTILDRFNLLVNQEDLLVILGPSGCGKSTLLYSIAGLIKPTHGSVAFDETMVFDTQKGINVPAERRHIGFVFQDYSLWPHMTVFENIAYPLRVRGMKKPVIEARVESLLESVDLSDKKHSIPPTLSGGEKQRVAIARAIAADPVLLLLDEPLANIDVALKTQLLALISRLKRELNIPVVYVTHDQKEAFEIANRMVIMNAGHIVQEGCPRHIYRHPANRFVAGFVGENNLLRRCALKGAQAASAQNELLAIRPEDIRISENGEYEGKVLKTVYKGNYSSLFVRIRDTHIRINIVDDRYHAGDTVRFDICRAHPLCEKQEKETQ